MLTFLNDPTMFQLLGILGTLFAILGSLVSAIAYKGKQAERYSPLNHFISELGEVGVSRLAWVFNLGLIMCGLCLLPACIILGLILPGFWAKVGLAAGVVTAIGLSLVGVFPMNDLKPHGKAAVTFFRGGLVMVLAFTLAIAFQPKASQILPPLVSLVGLPAILAFSGFLFMMFKASKDAEREALEPMENERPKVWLMPMVEWAIFITIVLWFVAIAIAL